MFICLRGFFKEGWGVGGSNCSKSGPRLLFSNSPLFYAPLPGETICKAFFHFKKRTQHHQTIFLSNRTECSQSRAIENWTRKYSSERHCLDLHTHCLCWWKKTHIFDAYMKPWEHLIKLTAVELKKKKTPPVFFLWCSSGNSSGPLKIRDQQVSEAAGVPSAPARPWGNVRKTGTRNEAVAGEKTAELTQRSVSDYSQRHPPSGQENECYIPGLKTGSEVKYQGHGGQNPCLNHIRRLSSYLKTFLSWKQQRNMGQGAQHNAHKPLANISFLYKYFIYSVLGAGIEQWKKKWIKSLPLKEFISKLEK